MTSLAVNFFCRSSNSTLFFFIRYCFCLLCQFSSLLGQLFVLVLLGKCLLHDQQSTRTDSPHFTPPAELQPVTLLATKGFSPTSSSLIIPFHFYSEHALVEYFQGGSTVICINNCP